ncbi:MAG TPA: sugar ABC transporter permease [Actinomycetota bacterium]|nr:sugar ABC transporter permease [Actinomycetota bacterium]
MSVAAEAGRAQTTERAGPWSRVTREFTDPEKRTAYIMILPVLLVILLIAAWPIVYAVYLSFLRILPTVREFVGVDNYSALFTDHTFYQGLLNTTLFTVVSVVLEFALGLGIALVLNRGFVGQGALRAIAIVPWAFPTVVSGIMWRLMYQDQIGIFSYWAEQLGIISGPVLASEGSILVGAILSDVWKTTPFVALLLLAGLQVIPADVYEASRVDGATPWQQFTRITLPLLKPAILVALLFRTLDAWRVYDLFWVMSDRQLESLSTYVFKFVRISQVNLSVGNAAAVFVFLSSLLIAFLFIRFLGTRAQEA